MPVPLSFPDRIALVVAEPDPRSFWRALARAGRIARVVELRLDTLGSVAEIVRLLERLAARPRSRRRSPTLIATCRRRPEGGQFEGSPSAQLAVLALAARAGCQWIDVDAATLESFPPRLRSAMLAPVRRIVSFHDFSGTPGRLEALYRRLARLGGDRVKIAATARCQRDNVALLELARRHRPRLMAVPMGTAGIPGRVLALRVGSPLAYAAPDRGAVVAPGQLRWSEMRTAYRAHRLRSRSRVYGVVGGTVAHSLSPAMHNAALGAAGLNSVYLPFEVEKLPDFLATIKPLGIAGFSVTHPHKQKVLRYLDGVDPMAEQIGAVNTVVVRGNGTLYGYNTDYVGFLRPLARHLSLEGSRVLVVGAGGAARAVAFAAATAGAFVSVTARRPAAARALASAVGGEALPRAALRRRDFEVIINCTPVGQTPALKDSPLKAGELRCRVLFDLVYNPLETQLLRLGRTRGIRTIPGWQMLVEQGEAQFEIWTGLRAPLGVMRRAVLRELRRSQS
jgi:3-dehydroquinate dehydratase/shikimate dehydrogenase